MVLRGLGIKKKTREAARKSRDSWFGKVVGLFQRPDIEDGIWEELEEILISADVGVPTTQKLLVNVRRLAKDRQLIKGSDILLVLKEEMRSNLQPNVLPIWPGEANCNEPQVILMVGVNGAGKTTSVAKLAYLLKEEGKSVILGACDTFRAAAVEQLQEWGKRCGLEVIAHKQGGDPGAVAFDSLEAAKARGIDVAIIDTGGRLHTKFNLMAELKKIHRVLSKNLSELEPRVIITLDATTGQNGLIQAKKFTEVVQCHGIVLAKLDGSAKGGMVFAIWEALKLPVLFIGTGEKLDDFIPFAPEEFIKALFTAN